MSHPTQDQLDAFIARAGFTYGWGRLESWARRMAEQAAVEQHEAQQRIEQLEEQLAEEKARRVTEVNAAHMSAGTFDAMGELARATMAEEYEFLTWFAQNADFGPADSDVWHFLRRRYTEETGKPVPLARRGE